jgi:hypothetical protein
MNDKNEIVKLGTDFQFITKLCTSLTFLGLTSQLLLQLGDLSS